MRRTIVGEILKLQEKTEHNSENIIMLHNSVYKKLETNEVTSSDISPRSIDRTYWAYSGSHDIGEIITIKEPITKTLQSHTITIPVGIYKLKKKKGTPTGSITAFGQDSDCFLSPNSIYYGEYWEKLDSDEYDLIDNLDNRVTTLEQSSGSDLYRHYIMLYLHDTTVGNEMRGYVQFCIINSRQTPYTSHSELYSDLQTVNAFGIINTIDGDVMFNRIYKNILNKYCISGWLTSDIVSGLDFSSLIVDLEQIAYFNQEFALDNGSRITEISDTVTKIN